MVRCKPSKNAILPDEPGWWWIQIRDVYMEPQKVCRRNGRLVIEVMHPGFQSTWLGVENFTWLGALNLEPVVR